MVSLFLPFPLFPLHLLFNMYKYIHAVHDDDDEATLSPRPPPPPPALPRGLIGSLAFTNRGGSARRLMTCRRTAARGELHAAGRRRAPSARLAGWIETYSLEKKREGERERGRQWKPETNHTCRAVLRLAGRTRARARENTTCEPSERAYSGLSNNVYL